jgi:lipid-A-disaccharide synthase
MSSTKSLNIAVFAGEPSGDIRAGELIKHLKERSPDISFWGIGGDIMASFDVDLIEHIRNLSILGVLEVIKHLPKIRQQYKLCTQNILQRKPDAIILVDYPGFNLKLAQFAHKHNIPIIYYIIPQVWAWGTSRVKLLKKYCDKIIVLFEFEKQFLAKHGVDSDFAGHPIVDSFTDSSRPVSDIKSIALLPGSRDSEVKNLLPIMLKAAMLIQNQFPGKVEYAVAESDNIDSVFYKESYAMFPDLAIQSLKNDTYKTLNNADIAIVASGTATLEAVGSLTPFMITYRSNPLSFYIAKKVLKIPFVGLANIVAGREVAKEFLQEDATSENFSNKALELLADETLCKQTVKELISVKEQLGPPGAAERAATFIMDLFKHD